MVATSMSCVGLHGMFYLAAAVSDFYVPWDSMVRVIEDIFCAITHFGVTVVGDVLSGCVKKSSMLEAKFLT
jgi:hypothetical protein